MSSIEATATVDADLAGSAPTQIESEAEMLCALADILRCGAFGNKELDALQVVAGDKSVDPAARFVARQAINWLAQQSELRGAPNFWQISADARH
jgi:hypothetical protein